jgi:DNA polymerase III epsilon subunit-like protein
MQYQFHHTPAVPPKHNDIRVAAALDCEMGTAVSGDSELIRITLIDYFSNEILVDNLVDPDVPMQHLNTRYSGVSWPDLKNARRRGMCLNGKAGARRAIWRYVDAGTIIVGHGVSNDMRALRWIHAPVVDSLVIESSRVKSKELKSETETQVSENLQSTLKVPKGFGKHQSPHDESKAVNGSLLGPEENKQKTVHLRRPGNLSLKTLAKSKLNREIQMNGKQGHDSLEDAIAARDLVHHSILNFDDWC